MAASWGKERRSGPKGTYWSLRKGRGRERVAVSLGYVTELEADSALKRMRSEAAAGTDGRVLALCKRDAAVGVRYLVGDRGVEAAFGAPTPLYASWSLRRYVDEV